MIFAIRVDDVGWTGQPSDPPPKKRRDAGLELARRFHDALSGLPWLAAVIPAELDDRSRDWLGSEPQGLTVALHGFNHRRVDGVSSEYLGMSYREIRARVRDGLDALGVPCVHTVPPFNAIEPGFEAACSDEGVTTIWGGLVDQPERPLLTPYGRYVPAYAGLYGATTKRMSASTPVLLDVLPRYLDRPGYAVVTLHVPWEAARQGDDFGGVRRMAKMLEGLVVSPEEFAGVTP